MNEPEGNGAKVETDETIIDEFSLDPFTYPTGEVYEKCKKLEAEIISRIMDSRESSWRTIKEMEESGEYDEELLERLKSFGGGRASKSEYVRELYESP